MRHRLISGLLSLFLLFSVTGHAARAADAQPEAWTVETLMATLAQVQQVDAVFEERKEMAALETPFVSSGFLRYRAPSLLEKVVLNPTPAYYRIDGDQVTVDVAESGRRDFAIDQYPGVRALVEAIRATLAGDQATLEAYFRVTLTGRRDEWLLRLEPRNDDIARRVYAVLISGSGDRLLQIETLESGGDRTVMTIAPTAG